MFAATGCAASYTRIQPDRMAGYQLAGSTAGVDLGYKYDALRQRGRNKKYSKKERKKGYQVVAVKVTNKTTQELNFSRDLDLMFGDRSITPVPSNQAAADLKQGVLIYLLYVLLNPTVGAQTDPVTGRVSGGTTFYTGPFIAAGNMIGAGAANQNLRKEFTAHDLTDRNIKPGETVYGIVSLRETNVAPLRLQLRNQAASTPIPTQPQPTQTPAAPIQAAPATSPTPAGSGR
ncbi:hypothetical protein [Hymenobacter sp.]|jgi:hypothetical protein|uniref:hypothetical protein n=1 Tax=Hymenobacter sp. TaxID=1898978 RepID=UPI002EDAB0C9